MNKKLPILHVCMFGNISISYQGEQILYGKNTVTKVTKLLLLLLYHRKDGISRNRLMVELFGRKELADTANNLRVYLFRLKKLLTEAGLPEYEYIVCENGVYCWDSPMETVLDVELFKNLLEEADKEEEPDMKLALLQEACQLYRGEFLEKLSGDEWVIAESVRCKELYQSALKTLCEILTEKREYEAVLHAVEPACEMYPFDDWQAVKIDCYIAMNRYKDAMKEYKDTAKYLFEELGVSPSEKMLEQFRELSGHISNGPQIISEIKSNLREESEEQGALYCNYPGFRDAYRMIRRGMERNGQSVFLVLCTLVDTKGHPMQASEKLDEMSEKLHRSLQCSLRRSDSFTKYSCSQYLVMLVGTNEENCQIAIDRISSNFAGEHKSWADHLECSVSSLMDATC